jgi:adenine C2-methylase RlmN of 23S rRNA A2503 and tRNA A37
MVVFLVLQSIVNTFQSNLCFGLIQNQKQGEGIKISESYWGTYNIKAAVSEQMCRDISGACGQLVVNLLQGTKES